MTNEHIAVVMAWLAQRITKAETFILEQAPDVIQQIIVMDFVQAISVALCLAMAVPFVVLTLWLGWKSAGKSNDPIFFKAILWMIGVAVLALLSISIAKNATQAIRIYCAPKAYLLERVGILR